MTRRLCIYYEDGDPGPEYAFAADVQVDINLKTGKRLWIRIVTLTGQWMDMP